MKQHYDEAFYAHQSERSLESGLKVLPLVLELFPVRSLIDLGCGVGTWLAAAKRLGVERAVGVEGSWVTPEQLVDPTVELVTHNLEHPQPVTDTFDLAMSLEVAEHLSPSRAPSFVDDLCGRASRVLFSAAVPGQGGAHHVNEQWQSWWVKQFAARGYKPLDAVRPGIWSDPSIPIHYRQNVLLYVREDEHAAVARTAGLDPDAPPWPLDVVHPDLYQRNLRMLALEPNFKERVRLSLGLPRAFLAALRRRFSS
jgi:SAM-dependent methyltransferase